MIRSADVVIVGGGMAGASLASEISGHRSVLILEAESAPGYHATGRSAAFWSESYGGPAIQPLTRASGAFLAAPPADFSDEPFLRPRGAIHLAGPGEVEALDRLAADFSRTGLPLERMDRQALVAAIPGLRAGWEHGLFEPNCSDIDVAGLHQAYLRRARAQGAMLCCGAEVISAQRKAGLWRIDSRAGTFEAEILVNAAGAWADRLALAAGQPPLQIQPYRRTLSQLRIAPPAPASLPLVIDASGHFYFKPDAGGRLWLSPHDETPCKPGDCAAEEVDVATAIDRLQQAVDWRVERVERSWAGLRSFAPDRRPVYGFSADGFFWCAGQGGFGIQTAPAGARLAASLLLGEAPDPMVAAIDESLYLAGRFTN